LRNYDSKSPAHPTFSSVCGPAGEAKRHFVLLLALSPTGC
jgi:hypothetical protein